MTRNLATTREAILEAAEAAFAERGYDGTSLQQIASVAGVSRGMPGYAFGSKDGLYHAVVERAFAAPSALVGELRSELRDTEAQVALASFVGAYIDFLAARPTYVRLLQRATLEDSVRLGRATAHLDALREGLSALAELLDTGDLRSIDPRQLFISIVALCFFPLAHETTLLEPLGVDVHTSGFLADRRAHVTDLLLHGLAANPVH